MRVLVVGKHFPAVRGTRALQMFKVTGALHDLGVEVRAITTADPVLEEGGAIEPPVPSFPLELISAPPYRSGLLQDAVKELWNKAAFLRRAIRLVSEAIDSYRPDVLLTAAVPVVFHQVGLKIKQRFPEVRWAAFYSDPRPLQILPKPFGQHSMRNSRKLTLHRQIFQRADAVLAPNTYMLEVMEQATGVSLGDRRHVVPHCGRKAKATPGFSDLPAGCHDLEGYLVHVGSLWSYQVTSDLLLAIRNVARKYSDRFKGLLCVGQVAPEILALAEALDMADLVQAVGVVSPAEAEATAAAAPVNLLADTPLEVGYFLHSKFADYAVSGRPILAVGPPKNPMRDYLEQLGGGVAVVHHRVRIESALEACFLGPVAGESSGTACAVAASARLAEPFFAGNVAKRYVEIFDQLASGCQAPGRAA